MKLLIGGAIALAIGVWVSVCWWWIIEEIIEGLIALGLVVGGVLAISIAARRSYRAKQMDEQEV